MEAVGATATPAAPRATPVEAKNVAGGIRVEELARRAEVSVDTIRFYQKRQLLPPPQRVSPPCQPGRELSAPRHPSGAFNW